MEDQIMDIKKEDIAELIKKNILESKGHFITTTFLDKDGNLKHTYYISDINTVDAYSSLNEICKLLNRYKDMEDI